MKLNFIITVLIATVWFANGFFCKVLNLVPRHQQIVERILSIDDGRSLTLVIGMSEILMAIWIGSGYKKRLSTIIQITVVATMNILEFAMTPDLLLWGKFNSLFALIFIVIVYLNEFHLRKKQVV